MSRGGGANRARLAVVGVIALAAALWFIAVCFRLARRWGLRAPEPSTPVVSVPQSWSGSVLSWILLGGGVVLALIGLWWLARQVPRSQRIRRYGISSDDSGRVEVSTEALAGAVAGEVSSLAGVAEARVRFFGALAEPEMLLQIDVEDRADIPRILELLETEVLPDLQRCLGAELGHLGVQIRTGFHVEGESSYVPEPAGIEASAQSK
ncbi:MAG: alkaline shock response membrane anchor protein AmaP [Acidipropionibacterium sp.]|jgi:hypothetical protein|nr:alkaline shock response membrane anchor protein AmaP [Acidipropionibacterium sp.]